jgi:hypothetical protein
VPAEKVTSIRSPSVSWLVAAGSSMRKVPVTRKRKVSGSSACRCGAWVGSSAIVRAPFVWSLSEMNSEAASTIESGSIV